jgi:DNA-binding transcriptional MerR regulator
LTTQTACCVISSVITRASDHVVRNPEGIVGISAANAYAAAEITYRQLDHWARQGWVRPSISLGEGRSGKRLYAADDVVRLSLLRHLALSRVNASVVGPMVAELEIPAEDVRVLWGPVGAKHPDEPAFAVVDADQVLAFLDRPGAFVVYDPEHARRRIAVIDNNGNEGSQREDRGRRKSA